MISKKVLENEIISLRKTTNNLYNDIWNLRHDLRKQTEIMTKKGPITTVIEGGDICIGRPKVPITQVLSLLLDYLGLEAKTKLAEIKQNPCYLVKVEKEKE